MGIKDSINRLLNSNATRIAPDGRKLMAEEVELMGYEEEDRRDWVRQEVDRRRKERLQKMLGVSNYGPALEQKPFTHGKRQIGMGNQKIKKQPCGLRNEKTNFLKPYKLNQ